MKEETTASTTQTADTLELNGLTKKHKSPLYLCVEKGFIDGVKDLIATAGTDLNLADKDGVTPLHLAIKKGYFDIASQLLDAGAAPNTQSSFDGDTPLHAATSHQSSEAVNSFLQELLAKLTIDEINRQNIFKKTALFSAADADNAWALEKLLEMGCDPAIADKDNVSVLHNLINKADPSKHDMIMTLIKTKKGFVV